MTCRKMPKTGVARKTHQTFAIDKLPTAWRDRIIAGRAKWTTWEQIEQETAAWEWDELTGAQRGLFAERHIPHSTLHRWYDVQVRQKLTEIAVERQSSLALAEKLGAGGYEKLDESVKNALADVVFSYVKDSSAPDLFRKALTEMGWLLARNRQLDIAKMKVEVEKQKVDELIGRAEKATSEVAKKVGHGGGPTLDDINRVCEQIFGLPPIERGTSGSASAE
jgi:hypothetical protein